MEQIAQTNATSLDVNFRSTQQTRVPLHRSKVGFLLSEQAGKFVSLDFVKSDGKHRTLTGRLGVEKHLAGGRKTVGLPHQSHLVLFDVEARGYRAVNLNTVQRVRAQHIEYEVTE